MGCVLSLCEKQCKQNLMQDQIQTSWARQKCKNAENGDVQVLQDTGKYKPRKHSSTSTTQPNAPKTFLQTSRTVLERKHKNPLCTRYHSCRKRKDNRSKCIIYLHSAMRTPYQHSIKNTFPTIFLSQLWMDLVRLCVSLSLIVLAIA